MGSGFVDYEQVADRYVECRSLPHEVLARWGDAVRPYLPSGSRRVLDLGAGTGIFSRGWPRWTSATVIAVEPSVAMIRAGNACDPAARLVRGVAEATPLRDARADVV